MIADESEPWTSYRRYFYSVSVYILVMISAPNFLDEAIMPLVHLQPLSPPVKADSRYADQFWEHKRPAKSLSCSNLCTGVRGPVYDELSFLYDCAEQACCLFVGLRLADYFHLMHVSAHGLLQAIGTSGPLAC